MSFNPIAIPQISSEPVASVLRVLQLQAVASGNPAKAKADFIGSSLPQHRKRVYGGQVLAQGLLAGAATVDPTRPLHSLHASFIRGGVFEKKIHFEVDILRDGRSFSARSINARQDEKTIVSMNCSFQEVQDGLKHFLSMPEVPGPLECRSALDLLREIDHPVAKFLGRTTAFDVRHVGENLYFTPAKDTNPTQCLWMRPRHPISLDSAQIVHRALLTYVVDQVMLEPLLRKHHLSWSTEGINLATLDHSQWFYRDIDINDWLLYVGSSPAATGSRGLVECQVFNSQGQHVSTIVQEGMLRVGNLS